MKRHLVIWLFCTLLGWFSAASLHAQNQRDPAKYLFLVEASSATAPRAELVALAVADLIERGLGGRMQDGDMFNVLPFNEQVNAGLLRQVWHREKGRPISNQAFRFLQKYRFEKKTRLDHALALAQLAMHNEGNLSVYLVVSGEDPIVGTPFDTELNDLRQKNLPQWRLTKGLCVIALVSERGKVRDWAIGVSEPPSPVKLLARKIVEEKPPPPPVKTNVVVAVPAPLVATNALPRMIPPKPATNQVAVVTPEIVKPVPPPIKPDLKPPQAPKATNPPVLIIPVPATNRPPEVKPEVVVLPKPPEIKPSPPLVATTNPVVATTNPVVAIKPPEPPPTNAVVLITPPAPLPATNPPESATANTPKTNALPPAQPIIATGPIKPGNPFGLLLIGACLLVAAGWIGFIWYRRTRPAPGPSLITQSMNRERKRQERNGS
jgi:hypothetical protein